MERYDIMCRLKYIYEEIVRSCDAKQLLSKETEIDELYHALNLMESEAYSQQEVVLLKELSDLNKAIQTLMTNAMNQMQRVHNMSPRVQKQYDNNSYADSYFVDQKY
ncbi:hypothetical protein MKY48_30960 [Paenibacillus sp. FSL W8-0187]|uniref:hypothetical protein n=1 Tax=Paenibacillus TaxID=44249 RepID=UPI0030D8CA40